MIFDPKTSRRTHEFKTNARQAMSELVNCHAAEPGIAATYGNAFRHVCKIPIPFHCSSPAIRDM